MNRHRLTRAIGWALAFIATWFAWAWLSLGFLPVGALALALAWDASRRLRALERRPGLPHSPNGHRAAAYLTASLLLALLIGFSPDWLVLGALGVALAVKLRARS
jgi:hypothetical protein